MTAQLPNGTWVIPYGPDANCTLAICPVDWSVLNYRPSLGASGAFIGLFTLAMIIHIIQGIRWREWSFMTCIVLGCVDEIIGYAGRIILQQNPFSFAGFLIQISMSRMQRSLGGMEPIWSEADLELQFASLRPPSFFALLST